MVDVIEDPQAETDDKKSCCEFCGCGLVLDGEGYAVCAECRRPAE